MTAQICQGYSQFSVSEAAAFSCASSRHCAVFEAFCTQWTLRKYPLFVAALWLSSFVPMLLFSMLLPFFKASIVKSAVASAAIALFGCCFSFKLRKLGMKFSVVSGFFFWSASFIFTSAFFFWATSADFLKFGMPLRFDDGLFEMRLNEYFVLFVVFSATLAVAWSVYGALVSLFAFKLPLIKAEASMQIPTVLRRNSARVASFSLVFTATFMLCYSFLSEAVQRAINFAVDALFVMGHDSKFLRVAHPPMLCIKLFMQLASATMFWALISLLSQAVFDCIFLQPMRSVRFSPANVQFPLRAFVETKNLFAKVFALIAVHSLVATPTAEFLMEDFADSLTQFMHAVRDDADAFCATIARIFPICPQPKAASDASFVDDPQSEEQRLKFRTAAAAAEDIFHEAQTAHEDPLISKGTFCGADQKQPQSQPEFSYLFRHADYSVLFFDVLRLSVKFHKRENPKNIQKLFFAQLNTKLQEVQRALEQVAALPSSQKDFSFDLQQTFVRRVKPLVENTIEVIQG